VERHPGRVTVDAIEFPAGSSEPGALVTMVVQGQDTETLDANVGQRLQAWLDRDDGVCDAFEAHHPLEGWLALFQRTDSMIIGATLSAPDP
jgi:hypothetical protein